MRGVKVDGNAVGSENPIQRVDDLASQPLLHREAASVQSDDPGEFGKANDALVRDITDPGLAEEREGMMLADRVEGDRTLHDLADAAIRTLVTFCWKRGHQLGIAFIALGGFEERADEATRRIAGSRRVKSHAHRLKDFRGVLLELPPLRLWDLSGRGPLPLGFFRTQRQNI